MLYYEAMLGMIEKAHKMMVIQDEEIRSHTPYICEKSR